MKKLIPILLLKGVTHLPKADSVSGENPQTPFGGLDSIWYANILLYQLSNLPNTLAMGKPTREWWMKPVQKGSTITLRDRDIEKWKKYASTLSSPSHPD